MYTIGKYNSSDTMADLICDNYPMILVISRFGIAMGFEDRTIRKVCEQNSVDTDTFLAIVNLLITENKTQDNQSVDKLSVQDIIQYLKKSHQYFLNYKFPRIRENLIEAISNDDNPLIDVVIRYFDEYVYHVDKHMMYEENTVFNYVYKLLNNEDTTDYNIDIFYKFHDKIEDKLTEFRNVIIKYYPAKSSNKLNTVLFDILACAQDLTSHNNVEDYLFTPAIRLLEQRYVGLNNKEEV